MARYLTAGWLALQVWRRCFARRNTPVACRGAFRRDQIRSVVKHLRHNSDAPLPLKGIHLMLRILLEIKRGPVWWRFRFLVHAVAARSASATDNHSVSLRSITHHTTWDWRARRCRWRRVRRSARRDATTRRHVRGRGARHMTRATARAAAMPFLQRWGSSCSV